MSRPSWEQTFMNMAHNLSKRSTCLRLQTASVIVRDNIIVSVGYNGVAHDAVHCCDYWSKVYEDCLTVEPSNISFHQTRVPKTYKEQCQKIRQRVIPIDNTYSKLTFEELLRTNTFSHDHHQWSVENELHGEMNAILFAGRSGISLVGSELYTIYSPCIHCAKSIVTSGISCVYYEKDYKRDTTGIGFLRRRGVTVEKLQPQ